MILFLKDGDAFAQVKLLAPNTYQVRKSDVVYKLEIEVRIEDE